MSKRDLWDFHECHEAVIRYGVDEPCDKTAVALRIDPEERHPYPVCARHSRNGGSRMVPLADVVRPVVEERNRVAADRDAAVARAEQAEAERDETQAKLTILREIIHPDQGNVRDHIDAYEDAAGYCIDVADIEKILR